MQGFPLSFLSFFHSPLSALEFVASWFWSRCLDCVFGTILIIFFLSGGESVSFPEPSGSSFLRVSHLCCPFGEAVFSIMPSAVSSLIVGGFLLYLLWDLATSFKRNRTCLHMISSVIDPDKISELPSLRLNPTLTKGICYLLRILSGYPYLGRFLLMRFRDVPQLVLRMQKWVSRVVSFGRR
jgi:hypothetical protein